MWVHRRVTHQREGLSGILCAGLGTSDLALINSDMPLGAGFPTLETTDDNRVTHWTPWIDPSRRILVSYGRSWFGSSIRAEFLFLVLSLLGEGEWPGSLARCDYEDKRRGTCNVFICNERLSGKRMVRIIEQKTKKDWAEFIKKLADERYPEAEM